MCDSSTSAGDVGGVAYYEDDDASSSVGKKCSSVDVWGEDASRPDGSDVVCADDYEAVVALAGSAAGVAMGDVVVSTDDGSVGDGDVADECGSVYAGVVDYGHDGSGYGPLQSPDK